MRRWSTWYRRPKDPRKGPLVPRCRFRFLVRALPLGALADYTVVDEGGPNKDWNPVWESRTARFRHIQTGKRWNGSTPPRP